MEENYSLDCCLGTARIIAKVQGIYARRMVLLGDNTSGKTKQRAYDRANKAAGKAMRRIREINFLLDLPGEK